MQFASAFGPMARKFAGPISGGTGVELGPELINDGEFNSTANWIEAGQLVSGGKLVGNGATGPCWQPSTIVAGTHYRVTFSVSNYVSGEVSPYGFPYLPQTADGVYSQDMIATVSGEVGVSGNAFYGDVDDFSVREIL